MPSVSARSAVSTRCLVVPSARGNSTLRQNFTKRHRNWLVAVFLVFLVLSVFGFLYVPSASASEVGWLDGFTYRKAISVSAMSGAGTGYQVPLTVWTNPITFSGRVQLASADAKIAIVGEQRFILTSTWALGSPITVWVADSEWNRGSIVDSSSAVGGCANDFYAYTFACLPDTIVMVGTNSSSRIPQSGFIAAYNVSSGDWIWEKVPTVGWITNVIYAQEKFYIVPAGNVNYFWSCNVESLFDSASWTAIAIPAFSQSSVENRFAYFNGEMFMLRSNHALYWELYKWDLDSTWILLASNPDTSRADNATPLVFPYVTATMYGVTYTVPFANGTWGIYFSSNGASFSQLANVPMINGLGGLAPKEIQCWAYAYSDNRIGVLNTKLSNTNSYVAIYDTEGNELRRGAGYVSHYSEAVFIKDGDYLVAGGEYADGSTPADLKIVNLNDPTALSTNWESRQDFGDLRFTDDDGVTQLDYWVQDYSPKILTNVWIKVNDNLDSQQKIYMYYGNSSATSTSNIENTFIFGEDFRTQQSINMAKWQLYGNPIFSFSPTSGMSMSKAFSYAQIVSAASYDFSENLRVVQMQRLNAVDGQSSNLYLTPTSTGNNLSGNENFVQFSTSNSNYGLKHRINNASIATTNQKSYQANDWLYTEIETNGDTYLRTATNGTQNYLSINQALNMTTNYLALQVSTQNGNAVTADWQYIFATKYVVEETITTTVSPQEAQTLCITATADSHSQIAPSGSVTVNFGEQAAFTLSAENHYHLTTLTVDGAQIAVPQSLTYKFDDVRANHIISISSAIDTYTITVIQPQIGSITPTQATVNYGDTPTFNIQADGGYHILDVKVDGSSVGAVTSYTFNPVEAAHIITAEMAQNIYYIHSSASAGGTIAPSNGSQGVAVPHGQNQTFTITPNQNYELSGIYVDNELADMDGETNSYTFHGVERNHDIEAVFQPTLPMRTPTPTPTQTPLDVEKMIIAIAVGVVALTSLTLLALKYPKKR